MLFEFEDRSDFPFEKPVPPYKLALNPDFGGIGMNYFAVGYYCVTVEVK